MKNANELTAAQIAAITPEQVYVVYSGKPGCACGCRGNYRVNPQHLAFATKNRGYEYDANEVSLAQVKRVLRIVQQNLDKLDCVSEEFASVKIETGYETFRVYVVYILPEVAKQFETERAGKCHDCGGDCDSILQAAQKSLDAAKPKAMKIRLQYKDGSIYNWTIRKASGGWEFTDHENYTRHSEGNWLALVSKFKLVAENYGMTLMSELS